MSTPGGIEEWLSTVPRWMTWTWLLAFGSIVGSFLNVVIHRVPRGLSVVHPRSRCPGCEKLIRWFENIPVLSWLALRGRCSSCKRRIPVRYPIVEATTTGLVLLSFAVHGPHLGFLISALFSCLLVALIFTDLELWQLPDELTLGGTFVGIVLSFWSPMVTPASALASVLGAIVVFEALNVGYQVLRGRDGMGAGDTKMAMLMGAFLGWQLTLLSVFLGALLGVVIGAPLMLLARRLQGAATTEDEEADEDEAGEDAGASGWAALAEYRPRTADEALSHAIFIALVASYALPHVTPATALAGLLVGIVLGRIHRRVASRRDERHRDSAVGDIWPLLGSIAGLPPTGVSVAVAAFVGLTWFVVRPWLVRHWPAPPDASEEPAEPDAIDEGPGIMQTAVPFGVFLGVGALSCLFFGQQLVDWYVSMILGPGPHP